MSSAYENSLKCALFNVCYISIKLFFSAHRLLPFLHISGSIRRNKSPLCFLSSSQLYSRERDGGGWRTETGGNFHIILFCTL